MYNKILDVVSTLTSDAEAAKQAAEQIFSLVRADKQTNRVKHEPIVKDGVTYKFCCWSKVYHPESEFVKGQNYTKAAYRIWHRINEDYKKRKAALDQVKSLSEQGVIEKWSVEKLNEEEAKALMERNKKDMVETYAEVAALGYTAEELQ